MSSRARQDLVLLRRYREDGDLVAREELVERMLPVARQLARRYHRGSEQLDDLVQVACLGLVKAIERFELEREIPFLRYAVPTMLGEIKRYFRDTGWAAHVPRGLQERVMDVKKEIDALGARLGRSPSAAEVADRLGLEVEDVLEALEAAGAHDAISLDAPRSGGADEDGSPRAYIDSVGADDEHYTVVEDWSSVAPALGVLPPREREILHLRFYENCTQSQIAERVGVSQMHVSRLLRRALERVGTVAANERVRGS
jgi:RNA polymerase sigma-B factor